MIQITPDSRVTLHHRIGLTDDSVLEDTFDEEPLTIQLGRGEMAEGLELSLIGLKPGDEQTIDIGPDLAFGFIDETLFRSLPRSDFDDELEMEQGLIIEFTTDDGQNLPGTILEFDQQEVRIDLNHPLAGQTVRYRVKIIDVQNIAIDDPNMTPKVLH
ncbi:MAG: FKBP-type peptidyl-prolyl cis-trans isomerase SlpA [Gammaproteobacteria bacterium]|jgi:FKBP-type peptidyl-prolyl cis-trans isomerase SlpA